MTRRGFLSAGLTALGGLVGCASLTPPLRTRSAPPNPALQLSPMEGSAEGLFLRIHWNPAASEIADSEGPLELTIDRSVDGSAARTIRSEMLHKGQLERLRNDGLRVRDTGLTAPAPSREAARRVAYRASMACDATTSVERSPVLRLRWPPAPPLPGQPQLQAVSDSSVRLRWPSRGLATRVLRRNVLQEADTPQAVTTTSAVDGTSRYVDEDVESGDVFAYQIAYGTPIEVTSGGADASAAMRWGPVSEALYVSVK